MNDRSTAERGIWGDEGGRQLRLRETLDGSVVFEIFVPAANTVIGSVTLANFRLHYVTDFLEDLK